MFLGMKTGVIVVLLAWPGIAAPEQQSRQRTDDSGAMKAAGVREAMDRLEKEADTFKRSFSMALDKSSYNGTHTEDTLARWAGMLEDEVDDAVEDFKENDSREFVDHFENAMFAASAVNRAMLRKDLATLAEKEWGALRKDLNHVAVQLRRPVLPNITVVTIAPAIVTIMDRADVKQVFEQIEASTDRFEEKLKKSIQHSTANMTPREDTWNRWADFLEDSSDDMLDEFKEKDTKGFQQELERTLMTAEALNRIMLRSDLSADAETEWNTVRSQLNTVATAFGHPVLGNVITR